MPLNNSTPQSSVLATRPFSAVLFIGFGGPEKQDDIMPFLERVTRGRGIPKERLEEVAHHYEAIGGKSPINEITRHQAKALEMALAGTGTPLPVYIGQRNWHPYLEDTLQRMAADGIRRAVGFPAAAHRCEASLERYVQAVETARQAVGADAPEIAYVDPWFDHPLFIDAIAQRVEKALASIPGQPPVDRETLRWFFTAHSIPCRMAKESAYVPELRRTAQLVCEKLGRASWGLAYSSRSGNPKEPWLEPDVCELIKAEAARGATDILLIPIGFIADHVEILFDLDVEAQDAARKAGVRLFRSQSVGDHPVFAQLMADVVLKRLEAGDAPEQRSSAVTRYRDGRREGAPGADSALCYCQPDASDPPCRRWTATAMGGAPAGQRRP